MTFSQEVQLAVLVAAMTLGATLLGGYFNHRLTLDRQKREKEMAVAEEIHRQLTLTSTPDADRLQAAIDGWRRFNSSMRRGDLEEYRNMGVMLLILVTIAASLTLFGDQVRAVIQSAIAALERLP